MAAALQIKETIKPTSNLDVAFESIERLHGWKALVETAPDLPFEKYREGIHKRIAIMLKSQDDQWLLCIGYLRHNNTDMLIIVNPSKIDSVYSLRIDNQRLFPGSGVYFEKFDRKKYQPYFIHDWRISADVYAQEIKAIFPDEK